MEAFPRHVDLPSGLLVDLGDEQRIAFRSPSAAWDASR
jgi:hypothetical protein